MNRYLNPPLLHAAHVMLLPTHQRASGGVALLKRLDRESDPGGIHFLPFFREGVVFVFALQALIKLYLAYSRPVSQEDAGTVHGGRGPEPSTGVVDGPQGGEARKGDASGGCPRRE